VSDASEVKAIALNTLVRFNTSAAIDRVQIRNNSSMYLRVYFGADPPASATDPGWHETIDPGGKPLLGVVGASASSFADRSYDASTPYLGVISILPFLPAGQFLTSGGVLIGGSFCHLTGYYPGEFAEGESGDEVYVQAVKQGRYQAVLGGYVSSVGSTTQASVDKTKVGQAVAILSSAVYGALLAANATAASVVNIYIGGYFAYLRPTGAGQDACVWFMDVALMDAAEVIERASTEFWRGSAGSDNTAATFRVGTVNNPMPPGGICIPLVIPKNAMAPNDHVLIRYRTSATAGIFQLDHNAYAVVDSQNMSQLMAMPGLHPQDGSPHPFNPQFNPQTW
jgi:hypothetical protein